MRSRLSQTSEKKNKKQLILSILGIVVLLFVLFKFGIPALTNLSLMLSNKNGISQQEITNSNTIVAPPILDQPFTATNSAKINVSGVALVHETITLFVNGNQVDTTNTKDNGTFAFTLVTLTQQQNNIQAKASSNTAGQTKTSNFSDTWNITYIQKAPSLTVDSPHDGDNFGSDKSAVVVKGKTDPEVRVTVNGFWAITDSSGNYQYTLTLTNGDNHITVIATDAAVNTTKQELTVKHSQ